MKRRFSFAIAALAACLAVPDAGFAQAAGATATDLSDEDKHDTLCILVTDPRVERGAERIAFFFGRVSARNPHARFTPTLNAAMPFFRELDRGEQNALSRTCQEEFTVAFG